MSVFPAEKSGRLSRLLEEEKELLEQIQGQTDEQTKLLSSDDILAFNKSLDERQKLIEKTEGLHQESNILMQSYISFSEMENNGKIAELEELRGQVRKLLTDISERNEKNLAMAKEMAEQYSAQINKMSMSRKSIGLYNQPPAHEGGYYDKKT